MKKLLTIAALAALTTTSCSFDKEVDVKQDTIGFGTYVGKVNTKAVEETTTSIKDGDAIGIFAYNHNNDFATAGNSFAANFMNNEKLYYFNNSAWKYENTKYWPNNGSKISFVAYHPYTDVTPTTDVTKVPDVTSGTVAIPFTVNLASPSAQKDLLWAIMKDQTKNTENGGKVSFAFTHALSKIQFKVKADAAYNNCTIRIKKVSLTGVTTNGTYTIPTALDKGDWTKNASDTASCVAYDPTESARQVLTTSPADLVDFTTTGLLLIPQTHSTGTKLKIYYEVIYTKGATSQPIAESKVFDLSGSWLQNTIYTYTFNVSLNAITFDVTVNNWSNADKDNGGPGVDTEVPNN